MHGRPVSVKERCDAGFMAATIRHNRHQCQYGSMLMPIHLATRCHEPVIAKLDHRWSGNEKTFNSTHLPNKKKTFKSKWLIYFSPQECLIKYIFQVSTLSEHSNAYTLGFLLHYISFHVNLMSIQNVSLILKYIKHLFGFHSSKMSKIFEQKKEIMHLSIKCLKTTCIYGM